MFQEFSKAESEKARLIDEALNLADSDQESSSASELKVQFLSQVKIGTESYEVPIHDTECIAVYAYQSLKKNQLSFQPGDRITIVNPTNHLWWWGKAESGNVYGFFPTTYVRLESQNVILADYLKNPDGPNPLLATSPPGKVTQALNPNEDHQDEGYFGGYGFLSIHLSMLSDKHRTETYRKAILGLKDEIKGKTVLDIGCGSGILSFFCVQAGAKHVYAVDASTFIEKAKQIAKDNGIGPDKITFLHGKLEEFKELPFEKVDCIVSEWMGTFLICESMIATVLWAKDKFLRKGGLMLPTTSDITLFPVSDYEKYDSQINFFDNVYGFDMSSLKEHAKSEFLSRPGFDKIIPQEHVVGKVTDAVHLDLLKESEAFLETIPSTFNLEINKKCKLTALGSGFYVTFSGNLPETEDVVLGTDPHDPPTHWKQVTFPFDEPLDAEKGDSLVGSILIERHKYYRRHFEVTVICSLRKKNGSPGSKAMMKKFPTWA